VQAVLDDLERRYPGFRRELCDDNGSLRRFINVYVNGREIRSLDGQNTLLNDGDEVAIIPAIAGGMDAAGHSLSQEWQLTIKAGFPRPSFGSVEVTSAND